MIRKEFERLEKGDQVRILVDKEFIDGEVVAKSLQKGYIVIKIDELSYGSYRAVWRHFENVELCKGDDILKAG